MMMPGISSFLASAMTRWTKWWPYLVLDSSTMEPRTSAMMASRCAGVPDLAQNWMMRDAV
eukprot:352516-Chlamydomonas_euryale.AAC.2